MKKNSAMAKQASESNSIRVEVNGKMVDIATLKNNTKKKSDK